MTEELDWISMLKHMKNDKNDICMFGSFNTTTGEHLKGSIDKDEKMNFGPYTFWEKLKMLFQDDPPHVIEFKRHAEEEKERLRIIENMKYEPVYVGATTIEAQYYNTFRGLRDVKLDGVIYTQLNKRDDRMSAYVICNGKKHRIDYNALSKDEKIIFLDEMVETV